VERGCFLLVLRAAKIILRAAKFVLLVTVGLKVILLVISSDCRDFETIMLANYENESCWLVLTH